MYLTPDTSATCPTMDSSCNALRDCNSYKVATASGVDTSQAESTVEMTVQFAGIGETAVKTDAPTSTLCAGTVAAAMTASGTMVDSNLAPITSAASGAATITFYKRQTTGAYVAVTRSAMTSDGVTLQNARPQVRALSAKPGTSQVYGMLSDGALALMGTDGDYTTLDSANCPFTACSVPRWFRSFALGAGPEVYGLDYGGGVWKVGTAGTLTQVTTLPPYIQQVGMN
jgi:hypothetical protein